MKKAFPFAVLLFLAFASNAQKWSLDKGHAGVSFSLSHMMLSEVDGSFTDLEASFNSASEDLSDAVFAFNVKAASIDTKNERRDKHLISADFFDVEKHPSITFISTSLKKVAGNNYKMSGNLNIKGITKPVVLDVVIKGPIVHPRNNKKMVGIVAKGVIDRFDFNIGDESGVSLGREITVTAKGEFSKD